MCPFIVSPFLFLVALSTMRLSTALLQSPRSLHKIRTGPRFMSPINQDVLSSCAALGGSAVWLQVWIQLAKQGKMDPRLSRKIIHCGSAVWLTHPQYSVFTGRSSAIAYSDFNMSSRQLDFSLLRSIVDGDVREIKLESILKDLQEMRSASLSLSAKFASDKQPVLNVFQRKFYDLFVRCWVKLAELEKWDSTFSLPPLYISENINTHIRRSSDSLFLLECGRRPAGDNPVYYGCKGVGKTTLLNAIGKISAVLLKVVIPIYWSYEMSNELPSLRDLFAKTVMMYVNLSSSDIPAQSAGNNELQDFIEKAGHRPVFLVDEFTYLYPRGIHIVYEILMVGKEMDSAAVILAASTTCVENYIYPKGSHGCKDYPDLNNSIFVSRSIQPIRDVISLTEYCRVRYPGWDISGDLLLDKTGGVGRYIENYFRTQDTYEPRSILEEVASSRELFAVCTAILSPFNHSSHTGPWPTLGISFLAARDVLVIAFQMSEFDAVSCINKWKDSLIFHRTDKNFIEFLVPYQSRALRHHIDSVDNLRMIYTLSSSIRGYTGGSPGHQNEDFLCDFVQTFKRMRRGVGGALNLTGPVAHFELKGSNNCLISSTACDNIDVLCNTLMKWKNESGLDRFWLVKAEDDLYTIHALQIKISRSTLKLTKGVLEKHRRTKMCGNMDDTTVAGILAMAEQRFLKLALQLKICFPTAEFQLGDLEVYCTKAVEKGIIDFKEFHPLHAESFQLKETVINKLRDEGAIVTGPFAFGWNIYGVEHSWLSDILPLEIFTSLFPSGLPF